jgi:hypothetical protein
MQHCIWCCRSRPTMLCVTISEQHTEQFHHCRQQCEQCHMVKLVNNIYMYCFLCVYSGICLLYQIRKPWKSWCISCFLNSILRLHMRNSGEEGIILYCPYWEMSYLHIYYFCLYVRDCWPVKNKAEEQQFRKTCYNWVSRLAKVIR